jgi:hypothetical protein
MGATEPGVVLGKCEHDCGICCVTRHFDLNPYASQVLSGIRSNVRGGCDDFPAGGSGQRTEYDADHSG